MDQNQTIDNDLQKAIDDITNTTNTDPVFSDPVATPSSILDNSTDKINGPIDPSSNPALATALSTKPTPAPTSEFNPIASNPKSTPLTDFSIPAMPTNPAVQEPVSSSPKSSPSNTMTPFTPTSSATSSSDITQIKTAALRDLAPLIDKLHLSSSQKFNLYRNIIEELHDSSVLEQAYQSARDITDETERAEALLYLVESIDKM